jgi:hypothetical protein
MSKGIDDLLVVEDMICCDQCPDYLEVSRLNMVKELWSYVYDINHAIKRSVLWTLL